MPRQIEGAAHCRGNPFYVTNVVAISAHNTVWRGIRSETVLSSQPRSLHQVSLSFSFFVSKGALHIFSCFRTGAGKKRLHIFLTKCMKYAPRPNSVP